MHTRTHVRPFDLGAPPAVLVPKGAIHDSNPEWDNWVDVFATRFVLGSHFPAILHSDFGMPLPRRTLEITYGPSCRAWAWAGYSCLEGFYGFIWCHVDAKK